MEANFERVKTGQTVQQTLMWFMFTVTIGWLVGDTLSRLIFGVVGQSPEDEAWPFVLMLHGVLGMAATSAGICAVRGDRTKAGRMPELLTSTAIGALLGFFYVGSLTDNNPKLAMAGSAIAAGLTVVARLRWHNRLMAIAIATTGVVATYGFAFLLGTTAIACLSGQVWGIGLLLGLLSILYVGLTIEAIGLVLKSIRCAVGTSFRGANLTHAKFDGARLRNADFSGAVGFWER